MNKKALTHPNTIEIKSQTRTAPASDFVRKARPAASKK
jgi:hypothetical protein